MGSQGVRRVGKLSRRIVRIVLAAGLAWCALVEIAECFSQKLFNLRLDGDWFLYLAGSGGDELQEFLQLYGDTLTLAVAGLLVCWGVVIGFCFWSRGRWWWGFVTAAILYVGWNCRTPAHAVNWEPLFVAYDTMRGLGMYAEMIEAGKWDARAESVEEGEKTNVVVVIGESMTTDRMSLYGYGKVTTPTLDGLKEKMTVMGPVRANFPDTVRSLRMMLTRASEAHPDRAIETTAVAFRKRGYRLSFISAQPKWGRYCGIAHLLFDACETRLYIGEQQVQPDEALLPYLKREIGWSGGHPFLIFVQLQGSHFHPKHRVPPWFKAPEGLDDYDRSVYYTDWILGEMIKSLPPKTVLVYVSDHGESPNSPNWRNYNDPSMWKVPVIVYPKNDSLKHVKTLDQVFHLLLNLIGE